MSCWAKQIHHSAKAKAQKYFDEDARDKRTAKFFPYCKHFSLRCTTKPRSVGESHSGLAKTHRRLRDSRDTQETGQYVAAPESSGSDQEGRMESVQLGGECCGVSNPSEKLVYGVVWVRQAHVTTSRRMERYMDDRQHLGDLTKPCPCSNRDFDWTGRRAWTADFISARLASRGHAVRKLQTQKATSATKMSSLLIAYFDSK